VPKKIFSAGIFCLTTNGYYGGEVTMIMSINNLRAYNKINKVNKNTRKRTNNNIKKLKKMNDMLNKVHNKLDSGIN